MKLGRDRPGTGTQVCLSDPKAHALLTLHHTSQEGMCCWFPKAILCPRNAMCKIEHWTSVIRPEFVSQIWHSS